MSTPSTIRALIEYAKVCEDRVSVLRLMAETLSAAAREADRWTRRYDDAKRIPDMLDDLARGCLRASDPETAENEDL